jgi:hypothetical protein
MSTPTGGRREFSRTNPLPSGGGGCAGQPITARGSTRGQSIRKCARAWTRRHCSMTLAGVGTRWIALAEWAGGSRVRFVGVPRFAVAAPLSASTAASAEQQDRVRTDRRSLHVDILRASVRAGARWGVRLATPRSASASPERACLRSKQLAAGGRDENHGRVPRRPPRFPERQRTIPRYPAGGRRRLPQAPAEPRKATVGKPCSPPLIPARPRPDRKRQDLGMMLGFVSFPNGRKYMGNRDHLLWSPVNPAA